MQYLVSVIDEDTGVANPGGSATADEMAATDVFNERLVADGHWVFAAGLGAPSTATVIDNRAFNRMVLVRRLLIALGRSSPAWRSPGPMSRNGPG